VTDERDLMAERIRVALGLHEDGVRLMRQNLRRRHPRSTDADIERRLRAWLAHRPGAEHGDAAGSAVPWPRR
jgi:hypothetical protein